jgi:hypothetical protein
MYRLFDRMSSLQFIPVFPKGLTSKNYSIHGVAAMVHHIPGPSLARLMDQKQSCTVLPSEAHCTYTVRSPRVAERTSQDMLAITSYFDMTLGAIRNLMLQMDCANTQAVTDTRVLSLGMIGLLALATRDLAKDVSFFIATSLLQQRDAYFNNVEPRFQTPNGCHGTMVRAMAGTHSVWWEGEKIG